MSLRGTFFDLHPVDFRFALATVQEDLLLSLFFLGLEFAYYSWGCRGRDMRTHGGKPQKKGKFMSERARWTYWPARPLRQILLTESVTFKMLTEQLQEVSKGWAWRSIRDQTFESYNKLLVREWPQLKCNRSFSFLFALWHVPDW